MTGCVVTAGGSGSIFPKLCECLDDIGLFRFFGGSSFGPVCSVAAVTRSAEFDWRGLGSLETWLPYDWVTGDVFYLSEIVRRFHRIFHLTAMLPPLEGNHRLVRTASCCLFLC